MTVPAAVDVLVWRLLLAAPPTPGGPAPGAPPGSERGEEFGKTSPIALVMILLLALATVLLVRSMSKRLRNVPASFGDVDTSRREPDRGPAAERLDTPDREAGPESRAGPTGAP